MEARGSWGGGAVGQHGGDRNSEGQGGDQGTEGTGEVMQAWTVGVISGLGVGVPIGSSVTVVNGTVPGSGS